MKHYFVTGTDTDVGKTRVAAALLWQARQQGLSTVGIKPVAAGCDMTAQGLRNDDALVLQAQCQPPLPYARVNPVALAPALAPHIAAQDIGLPLQAETLAAHCQQVLTEGATFGLVEGAGGWRVPLNQTQTLADLAQRLALPVILVVGIRLGCINHALLSAEAIAADGLPLAGWVANGVDPNASRSEDNIRTIAERIEAPCLGVIPYLSDPQPNVLAAYIDLAPLITP